MARTLNHLEYRVAAGLGAWYCARRRISPGDGLLSARAVLVDPRPEWEQRVAASDYAARSWWWLTVATFGVMVGYGVAFDELFYTRTNPVPLAVLAALTALLSGLIVEATVTRIRQGFLARSAGSVALNGRPPRYAFPKAYDFWLGVAVAVLMFLALFATYVSAAH